MERRRLEKELIERIAEIVEGRLSTSPHHLLAYSRDLWPMKLIEIQDMKMEAETLNLPDAVVWVKEVKEVVKLLRFCSEKEIPVIPFGGGSGVCGGTVPVNGGIVVDLKLMDKIRNLNELSLLVEVEAGANGERFERMLNKMGYTLGHFPSSMYCSTVGGWVSTRSAGQASTLYGKIEDMVVALEVVLPDGSVLRTKETPRGATGPDLKQVFIGSEGTLGIITSVVLRIHPYPEHRGFSSFFFSDLSSGISAIRKIMRAGAKPAVLRLYDPVDTLITSMGTGEKKGGGFGEKILKWIIGSPSMANRFIGKFAGKCLLIMVFEGTRRNVYTAQDIAREICKEEYGIHEGEKYAKEWFEHRYSVSFGLSRIFSLGLFADTMEVASPWDRLENLYYEIKNAISKYALVMAHFSHAYEDGCNIYFTFVGGGKNPEERRERYISIWNDAMEACLRAGGAISHHHGIGLLKRKWLKDEHGKGYEIIKSLKSIIDPKNIMNPGKLL